MRLLISISSTFLIAFTLLIGIVSASWAYLFVVNDGKIYVITDERVAPNHIGPSIGKVTKYSDSEGTYSGNFSNRYPKGTKYYEIIGIEINDAIAIKENEMLYVKATYGGEYAGDRYNWSDDLPYVLIVLIVGLLTSYFIKKRLRQRDTKDAKVQ
ncbi:hypothetical protein [Paenibacillus guangzhouensis]|uniref:hypothetical protein n=1 Tax=Paenibacillus guangzhouensis TaxID=1473112 RepID=UPI001D11FD81|nr:hypothetical protein [Paenibacillus guangzhouensis]